MHVAGYLRPDREVSLVVCFQLVLGDIVARADGSLEVHNYLERHIWPNWLLNHNFISQNLTILKAKVMTRLITQLESSGLKLLLSRISESPNFLEALVCDDSKIFAKILLHKLEFRQLVFGRFGIHIP